jgi:hypothetical protein
VPAGLVAVHDVVVQQREVVHQFDGRGGRHGAVGDAADGRRRQQHQRRSQGFARPRVGGFAESVEPAHVVSGDAAHRAGQRVDRGPQGGLDRLPAPGQEFGRGAGLGDGRHRPTSTLSCARSGSEPPFIRSKACRGGISTVARFLAAAVLRPSRSELGRSASRTVTKVS